MPPTARLVAASRLGLALLLALFLCVPAARAQTGLPVPDYSFEQVSVAAAPNGSQYGPKGSPWAFASGAGLSANGSGFTSANPNAPDGAQVAFIQGIGTVSQPVPGFQAGVTYTLTVSAAQRDFNGQPGGVSHQTVQVTLDGTVLNTITPTSTAYADYSLTFTAAAGSHTLTLTGAPADGNDDTAFLDDVRLTGVPASGSPGQVRYAPRPGNSGSGTAFAARMVGGRFQGSADGVSYTDLYTVTQAPPAGVWAVASLGVDPRQYRYLRYLSPDAGYGNVAEVEFDSGSGAGAVKLTGTPFGTPGSYNGAGNDYTKALDGDLSSFFDGPNGATGDYVGIDRGTAPGFALSLGQSALTIAQGDSRGVPVTVTATGGFAGAVNLSVSAPATGSLQTAFVPATLTGGGASRLFVTVPNTLAPGTYPLTVTATSGATTQQQTLALTVTALNYEKQSLLTLTDIGTAAGFGLTTFASGFPATEPTVGYGPMGIAFPGTGILVSDYIGGSGYEGGNVRLFPTDTDGQSAGAATVAADASGKPYDYHSPSGLATSNGQTYLCENGTGDILRLDGNGHTLGQVVSGLPGALGIIPNPLNGHLFVTGGDSIHDVDPVAGTSSSWLTDPNGLDGLTISGDGSTLYSLSGNTDIVGYDTTTKAKVFDLSALNPVEPIVEADGTALGSGSLSGELYVNCNDGRVWQVDMTNGDCVQVAVGGTRGDFATPDPSNGSLLLTQSATIMRLTAPAGGRFGQAPPAPLGLTALPGNGQVALAWNPVAGATSYTLSRALSPSGPFQPVAANISGTAYTDPGLVNGTTYYYVVSASNGFGSGPTSNVASAAPSGALPLPANAAAFVSQSVPASMTAGQTYPVTVTMKNTGTSVWTDGGNYRLGSQSPQDNTAWTGSNRVALPGSPPASVQPGATAAFTFNVTAPSSPGSYAFQWRMVQDGVQWFGDFTPQVAVSVHLALAAPSGLTAAATGGTKITLYWAGVPGATGYNVYRGTSAGGEDYAHPVNGPSPVTTPDTGPGVTNTLMFSDVGLVSGTEYFYTVTAVYAAGESGPCNEDSAIPDPNAIPWDTGDPAQIVPELTAALAGAVPPSDPTDPESGGSVGMLTASGPDGVVYVGNNPDGSPPAALAAIGTVDSGTGEIDYADGTVGQLPNDESDALDSQSVLSAASVLKDAILPNTIAAGSPPVDLFPTKGQPTGPYYKLETDKGYYEMTSTVILPDPLDNSSVFLTRYNPTHSDGSPVTNPKGQPYSFPDVADIYEGGRVTGGSEMDAGLQYSPDQLYKGGWQPFMGGLNPNKSIPFLNGTMISVYDPNTGAKGPPIMAKVYVKGVAPDGLYMTFIAPGQNTLPDKTVILQITGNYQLYYPNYLSSGPILGPSGFGTLTLSSFTSDWTRNNLHLFRLKRANSIAQLLYDPAKSLPVKAPASYVYRPYPDGLVGEVSPTDPDIRGFRRSGSYVYGAGWGDYSGDQNSVEVFGPESGSLTNDQVSTYGSYPRRPLGYVTWYDQNEFFWQSDINLRTTR